MKGFLRGQIEIGLDPSYLEAVHPPPMPAFEIGLRELFKVEGHFLFGIPRQDFRGNLGGKEKGGEGYSSDDPEKEVNFT